MLQALWLVPVLPLLGFAVQAIAGLWRGKLSERQTAAVGVGSVGASMLLALAIALVSGGSSELLAGHSQHLWAWMSTEELEARVVLYLDRLSLFFVVIVTVVSFLIHLYASAYMSGDTGYRRFFAYMNLFVGSMLVLVLAGDLVLLFLGWEGVGAASFLLIGFWFENRANGAAARKAFVVTRIGDAGFLLAVLFLATRLGSFDVQELLGRAAVQWTMGSSSAVVVSSLLLIGAMAKSAQLPLHTWLPDAMAGPTPVSALLHAATMVTAGVYLIARTHALFALAPSVALAMAVVGAVTLLAAAASALFERDIKRVLAYSTMSQIGYMFLALGVGAWTAASFHFGMHAFFKALLFLGAGVILAGTGHERDISKLGGLRRRFPRTFWVFLIGSASLAGLPWVTAGFYSKDWILATVRSSPMPGSAWLLAAGLLGVLLTSLYAFRLVFVVFFGETQGDVEGVLPGRSVTGPLWTLAVLSLVAGLWAHLGWEGILAPFSEWMRLPTGGPSAPAAAGFGFELATGALSLLGVYLAWWAYAPTSRLRRKPRTELGQQWADLLASGWRFDALYDRLFVRPMARFLVAVRRDVLDAVFESVGHLARELHRLAAATETGRLRWYATVMSAGVILLVALALWS